MWNIYIILSYLWISIYRAHGVRLEYMIQRILLMY